MDSTLVSRIRNFVISQELPTIQEFLAYDAPAYELTVALTSELAARPVSAQVNPTTGACTIQSNEGTVLLQITKNDQGIFVISGLFHQEISELIGAVRIHEVESLSLVNLPPEIRKADLERMCSIFGVTIERLQRLTNIWTALK